MLASWNGLSETLSLGMCSLIRGWEAYKVGPFASEVALSDLRCELAFRARKRTTSCAPLA